MIFDYLIVGAGLYGSMFAYKAKQSGKKVIVIDRRDHTGGNLYCKNIDGINVHMYGPHIFHTSNREVWDFVNSMTEFVPFIYSPIANYNGRLFNLPFNMNTFKQMWGVKNQSEAKRIISEQISESHIDIPKNLEEQAICMVGKDIYEILIKGYTEKQWGRPAKELPPFIIKRLPIRYTFNNNYFDDIYQGIPKYGYNALISKLLDGIEVRLKTDFLQNKDYFKSISHNVLYTGCIDEYYSSYYGKLEYRGLRFEHQQFEVEDYQGTVAMNFTDNKTPYTRIIEHKHFIKTRTINHTVITSEYPHSMNGYDEAFYPVNDVKNNELYQKYSSLAHITPNIKFGGRLGEFIYYNMDQVVEKVLGMDIPDIKC